VKAGVVVGEDGGESEGGGSELRRGLLVETLAVCGQYIWGH
jgi:hypothetical protein